jgi:hypothetical protein
MTDATGKRKASWSDWQNDLIVAKYFELDRLQLAGMGPEKERFYRDVADEINRGPGSTKRDAGAVGQKLQNVSGVLKGMGRRWTQGLSPRSKFQQSLVDAVERYFDAHPEAASGPIIKTVRPAIGLIVEAPPPKSAPKPKLDRKLERIARKFNYAEMDFRNRQLGRAGEEFIYHRERELLLAAGKPKLAKKVEWTADKRGDGLGYDIKSFDPSGAERWIEVKTTNGPRTTDFFLSRTEKAVSEERPDIWHLFRLHSFAEKPTLFVLTPPLIQSVDLQVENWRAHMG